MKKLLFIYNPNAGNGRVMMHLDEIITAFGNAEYLVELYRTKGPKEAKKMVMERAGEFDLVVCSGGDGTLSEVVEGMMLRDEDDRIPIGYIPAGSTNDSAKSYNIPLIIKDAAHIAVNGEPFKTDISSLNGDAYSTYVIAFGKLSAVSCFTPQEEKRILGYLAYLIEAIKILFRLDGYDMQVEYVGIDGESHFLEGQYFLGMFSNTVSIGGIRGITGSTVDFQDGRVEVMLLKRPKKIGDFAKLVKTVLIDVNKDTTTDMVTRFKASQIKVSCSKDVQWVVDGENGGRHKEALIDVYKCAVEIMINGESIKK